MNKKQKSLVVVGSVAYDSVKTPFGQAKRALGGSAVYFSCAARFFTSIDIVGVVGKDFSKEHLRLMKHLGINTDGIEVRDGKTFFWKGLYEDDLSNAITQKTELNVFAEFQPKLNPAQVGARYLFLANINPKLQMSVLNQIKKPEWVALDTMNFWIEHARPALLRVLKRVNISLMNDAEIRQLTGEYHLAKAVRGILKLGPEIVVVKRGEYGVWCFTKHGHFAIPAFLLEDIEDPTGAGDSFAGGFLGYLARAKRLRFHDFRKAAVYGSIIASYNVQSFSIRRLARLTQRDIEKRLREYRNMLTLKI